jgi:8-oxo-dGTP diphosphatase
MSESKAVGVGVGILIFNENNEILMGQRLNSIGAGGWSPPGGHLEVGETFEECAIREAFEETGLTLSTPTFVALTNNIFKDESKHFIVIFMKTAYPAGQTIVHKEHHKTTEWQWFSLDNLPSNLFPPFQRLLNDEHYGFSITN